VNTHTLRRTVLVISSTLACLGTGCSSGEEPIAKHVILISCDTLRADRLGMYGYPRGTSPNLDTFASEGVVFDEAYATAPMTLPSISSMLTGRLPFEIGVDHDNHRHMSMGVRTLPELLRDEAGVTTGAVVSNWLLRRPDGIDQDFGVWQGFADYDDRMGDTVDNRGGHWERQAPGTTDAAIEWLEAHRADESTFLWVHYQDPHGPYTAPAEFRAAFAPEQFVEPPLELGADRWGLGQVPAYQVLGTEQRPEVYRARYDAEVAFFDRELGRLFAWLRANGRYDEALIVFTSDHGESLGEHDYWFSHGENVFRELVRVPLVIRMPGGRIAPHNYGSGGYRRVSMAAGLVDIWATVATAFGVPPGPSRGISLISKRPEQEQLYSQYLHAEIDRPSWEAWSDGRYRVLQETMPDGQTGEVMLFDLQSDPYEKTNLARTRGDVMLSLNQRIFRYQQRTRQPVFPGVDMTSLELTPAQLEAHQAALRATGYAGDDTSEGRDEK